eukprot:jgi/Botrbrau1/19918/Bobra.0059s0035.1
MPSLLRPGVRGESTGVHVTAHFVNPINLSRTNVYKRSLTSHWKRRCKQPLLVTMSRAGTDPAIMVNACTGKMGHATAEAVIRAGLELIPFSFTGQSEAVAVGNVGVSGYPVELIGPERRQEAMERVLAAYPGIIIIDFTLPQAVNDNAVFYCRNHAPFVMGTTGGDREKLLRDVEESGNYAVIAPQMGKQVSGFPSYDGSDGEQFQALLLVTSWKSSSPTSETKV